MLVERFTDPTIEVLEYVAKLGNHSPSAISPLFSQISQFIAQGRKLTFILPAFPAKSANREKTHGPEPDLGEFLALSRLQSMCQSIGKIYGPGAEVVICSDGRVFNDLVMVSNTDLENYRNRIAKIISDEGLTHLTTFCLDDCYTHKDFALMREQLCAEHAPNLDDLRIKVRTDKHTQGLFNGVHRFLKEDLAALRPDLSKNQLMKHSKALTYLVLQRSAAWDGILAEKFRDTLRFSIHPYPVEHRKFGVQLVSSPDRWATPWHNVTLKVDSGFQLVKRKTALALGAQVRFYKERYAYYEVA